MSSWCSGQRPRAPAALVVEVLQERSSKLRLLRSCEDDTDTDDHNGHQVRSEGPSAAAARRDAVTQAEGHGREEHAQPLPQEHGRPH